MDPKTWHRFDFAAVSLFAGHADRARTVRAEFARAGLAVTEFWGVRTDYDAVIERNVVHSRMCAGAYLNITLKHLAMVKTAIGLGAQRALFFEDDVRFLRDEALLGEIVAALPDDFDVALFDWVQRNKASDEECRSLLAAERRGGHWAPFRDLRSCAFYALSRRAMERYAEILERPATGGGKLKICDQHWWDLLQDGSLRGYCAIPCAGVQGVAGGASPYDAMWARYRRSGIERAAYAD